MAVLAQRITDLKAEMRTKYVPRRFWLWFVPVLCGLVPLGSGAYSSLTADGRKLTEKRIAGIEDSVKEQGRQIASLTREVDRFVSAADSRMSAGERDVDRLDETMGRFSAWVTEKLSHTGKDQ